MTARTVVAFFETSSEARLAADDAVAAGVDRGAVSVVQGAAGPSPYVGSLDEILLPEADHEAYAEGVHRGGALVAVRIEDARVDLMARVLEDAGAVDLDAREREWRGAGWNRRADGGGVAGPVGGASGTRATTDGLGAPRLHAWRPAGRGTGRVRSYAPAGGTDDERTVGDPHADPMRLNRSHPARHGGL